MAAAADAAGFTKPFYFDRAVTTVGHDFAKPSDLQVGRVVDRYAFDAASVVFAPASYSGVRLRVHFNGDRVLVKRPASVVVRVVYVNMLDERHLDDGMVEFPKIWVEFEQPSEGFPKAPLKVKATGGFTERGSQFALLYKLFDSSKHFSFSGITLSFEQSIKAGTTVFKQLHGFVEVTHLTMDSFDPGPISKLISGRKWLDASSVVREVLNSEVNYLSALTTLISNYKLPMQASNATSKALLSAEDIGTLFCNVESILSAHTEFLRELEDKVAQASKASTSRDAPVAVAEAAAGVFLRVMPLLRSLYSVYAVNYPSAVSLWDQRRGSSALLVEFVQEANQASGRPRGLYEFLLMPMQRMSQLTILVQEMHKMVAKAAQPSDALRQAVELMHGALLAINDSIVRQEQAAKMLEIQQRMSGIDQLIVPARTFIHEGFLMKISSSGIGVDRRWFFLFSDCIIYCKLALQRRQFVVRGKWDLSTSHCRDLQDTPRLTNAFYMVTPKRTYVLVARTEKSKRVWMDSINHQVAALISASPSLTQRQAKFREPRRSLLTFVFQRDYSSEQLYKGELEQLKAMNKHRKDSFHDNIPEHLMGSDDSHEEDEDETNDAHDDDDDDDVDDDSDELASALDHDTHATSRPEPIPGRSAVIEAVQGVRAFVQRLPSLRTKPRKLSNAEISARINVFQSNRLSAADFLLEALPSDVPVGATTAEASSSSSHVSPADQPDNSTPTGIGYLPPLPPPPTNLHELVAGATSGLPISAQPTPIFDSAPVPPPPAPAQPGQRTRIGLPPIVTAPASAATVAALAEFRPRPLSVVLEEEDDEVASSPKASTGTPMTHHRKPSLIARNGSLRSQQQRSEDGTQSRSSTYSFTGSLADSVVAEVPEDLFVNEPIPVQAEDIGVVNVPVLYTTTAGDVLKELLMRVPAQELKLPTSPDSWCLFEVQVGQSDRILHASEFVLATVLAWEAPEQMRFVARRKPSAVPMRFRSPSITVRRPSAVSVA